MMCGLSNGPCLGWAQPRLRPGSLPNARPHVPGAGPEGARRGRSLLSSASLAAAVVAALELGLTGGAA